MEISIVGAGMGSWELLTVQAARALENCQLLLGSRRLLEAFPGIGQVRELAATPQQVAQAVRAHPQLERACVLVSGDVGFYSLTKSLLALPELAGARVLCGISSLQYFCARLGQSWEEVAVLSLHGRQGDLEEAVRRSKKLFLLAGGATTPELICGRLAAAGLGELPVAVGEELGSPRERITRGTAAGLAGGRFSQLSVLLVENPAPRRPVAPGLPDGAFLRGQTPMTKEEVRAVCLAKLHLQWGQTLWDVGAGTGSISVEAARLTGGEVCAIERDEQALALLQAQKERFGLARLRVVAGSAPAVLAGLPAPDGVFIGGSSGQLEGIFAAIRQANPTARVVLTAISLETLAQAADCFSRVLGVEPEVVQLMVAKAKRMGGHHLMLGQNPIYILSGGGGKDD
ncbi:MAG TPA: precorrin-6y C5,15-methyltransferase (decarboxylating) subunit CbiE [Candidatus Anaerotruncus excrementipullorum]|uniref:Precorrin-6y C5,15-methyltransferase (Decarboxylating) subunit CbiE n=1 Tax=Candidatus Anaerotruncus excrementipullorum TaxID=2838465 RepID=A0A9D2B834_9FIRM|nr:precorrin-6y C5,15-methyltransferase (decarboxylating) subunit CbiE [Candidatus Anaerotruncus excrementipullorum]